MTVSYTHLEIASYTDYKENVTYYYNYDYENKLINVNATNGNNISYTYDTNSNLIGKHNINGDNNYTYTCLLYTSAIDEINEIKTKGCNSNTSALLFALCSSLIAIKILLKKY